MPPAAKKRSSKKRASKKKATKGRPTVRSRQVESKLKEALELGLSQRRACHYAGIGLSTFKAWIQADEHFRARVNAHEAAGCVHHARTLWDAADMEGPGASAGVAAAKFYLPTHDREAWVDPDKQSGADGVTVAATLADLARLARSEAEKQETPSHGDAGS